MLTSLRVSFRKYHKGGKTQHRESLRGRLNSVRQHMHHLGGLGACPPRKFLAFRSSEIDSDAIWMVKVASLFL